MGSGAGGIMESLLCSGVLVAGGASLRRAWYDRDHWIVCVPAGGDSRETADRVLCALYMVGAISSEPTPEIAGLSRTGHVWIYVPHLRS